MAEERYILKPLTNEDGSKRGYRLEIDEFLADNAMTNLFLVALAELQKDSLKEWNGKPDWLTYYSLAGIHGQPREEWNGYPNDVGKYGYCHHSQNTFPTWHRPYMFLYESVVHQEMVKQAQAYPNEDDRKMYLDAASRFRLPYWDIIMPRKAQDDTLPGKSPDPKTVWACPTILKQVAVFVKHPRDDLPKDEKGFSEIDNPLAFFSFPKAAERAQHKKDRKELKLGSTYNSIRTTRVPQTSENTTDDAAVDLAIQRQASSIASSLWQMLNPDEKAKPLDSDKLEILINEERSWESFATNKIHRERIQDHEYSTVSLESLHDGIHILLGTGQSEDAPFSGHIGNPSYAAFDPIFWLHHNNIERLLCLYQALYPLKYPSSEDSKTQLFPFMTGVGRECYTSDHDLIKNYWESGYAIPGDKKLDTSAVKEKVKEYLTNTYYWATNITNTKPVFGPLRGWPKNLEGSWALHGKSAVDQAASLKLNAITTKAGVPEYVSQEIPLDDESFVVKDTIIEGAKVIQLAYTVDSNLPKGALTGPLSIAQPPIQITWNAHIKVRKFAFNGSFSIHLFIGHVKDDQPERYMTKKNEVGFTGVFASSLDSGCASCAKNQEDDILIEDVVPLTTTLYDYLEACPRSDRLIRDGMIKTIPDLESEHVEPFLQEHLTWRMIDLESKLLVGQEQQAKLEIKVTSRQFLRPTEGNPMGVYGPYRTFPAITSTKPGGYGYTY